MKQYILRSILSLLVFLYGCPMYQQRQTTAGNLSTNDVRFIDSPVNVRKIKNAVVALMEPTLNNGYRPVCAAFFVSPQQLATAAHCVSAATENTVFFSTLQNWQSSTPGLPITINTATILQSDRQNDVAILNSNNFVSTEFLTLYQTTPQTGERVYFMGFPGGLPWVLSDGIVAVVNGTNSNPVDIIATPPIFGGSSGGPLIDNHGRVIGVLKGMMFRQSSFGVYSSARFVTNLLMPQRNVDMSGYRTTM